ncbi:hypothetical protein SAMN06298216_1670 [Spirosomataceae bacterium TFI 002]|nr:hypothetical protein SAMN06298216_1670 [Spirosomataceae bacterium TFI 002]
MYKNFIIILFAAVAFISCNSNEKKDHGDAEIKFVRLDEQIMNIESEAKLQELFEQNDFYTRSLFRTTSDDTSFVNYTYNVVTHPETQKFYKEVLAGYGDFSALKNEFKAAFGEIKKTYPNFVPPTIYTTFTGLENDIYVSDSTVIISIEAFGGPKASYRPIQPEYLLKRYDRQYIVPTVIRLLSQTFVEQSQSSTLLNDMIYFGKTFEFTREMMPNTSDSLIIGYADSTMKATWYSQDLVWAYFIDKQLLYEQKPAEKEKYLGERPFVTEIGPACPGRIGQWLGWRIIQKFRTENPDVSFQELMKLQDPEEVLRKSKYRGLVEE